MTYLLLAKSRREQLEQPSNPERLRVVPIIFNVKGYDLVVGASDATLLRAAAQNYVKASGRGHLRATWRPAPFATLVAAALSTYLFTHPLFN